MSIKSWGINLSYRVRQIISLLFILGFFSLPHTVSLESCHAPESFYCTILKRRNSQLLNFHILIQFGKMQGSAYLIPSHSRESFYLVVQINCALSPQAFSFFSADQFTEGKTKICMAFFLAHFSFTSLRYLLHLCLFLSCVCFVLQCASVRSKMLWLLKVRLLHWSTKSKCVFFCLTRAVRLPRQTYNAFTHRQSQKCALDASTPKRLEYRASSFSTLPGKQLCLLYCQIHI